MTDYMAQMLNELMGSQRDVMPGEKKEINYEDSNVCTDFLVDFCTHEIFRNTKNDLGFCNYPTHDESMKRSYNESNKKWKLGFETRFLERIKRIHEDVQRKILKHESRLAMTQGENSSSEEVFEKKIGDLRTRREQITRRIESLMDEAQLEGEKGNVGAAQSAVEKADRAKIDRDEVDAEEVKVRMEKDRALMLEENVTAGNRQMQVCQICGCFMLMNDAPQRIDDHLSGKLHIAYQNIQDTIKKMENEIEERKNRRKEEYKEEERKKDKEREERRKRKEGEKKRSRSRSRSRDRSERRDKEKEKHRDRGDHHKKDHKDHKDRRDHKDHKDRHRHDRDHKSDRDRHRSSRESDRDRRRHH